MDYLLHIAILILLMSILAWSLNLVVGSTGLFSVAHGAFFGIGAYAIAILTTSYHLNFFSALFIGMIVTSLVATVISLALSRWSGDKYLLGSLGFHVLLVSLFVNWSHLTNGPLGITNILRPSIFGHALTSNISFFFLLAIISLLTFVFCRRIDLSSFGRVLHAIREDEIAIRTFGYQTKSYKTAIFVISAVLAAMAGSFFASYISFIDPSSFQLTQSIFIMTVIIFGGLGNQKGALLGAACLTILPELLRFGGFPTEIAAQLQQILYGLALIFLMLFRPQGLLGTYRP